MGKRLALILLRCVLCVTATAQQPALTVGTATAVTGQTVTGFIEVSAGSDVGTNIPVAVIRQSRRYFRDGHHRPIGEHRVV